MAHTININMNQGSSISVSSGLQKFVERFGQPGAIQRLDGVEQVHRLAHLVRLERADQVEGDSGQLLFKGRPFGEGFLHPVFPEQTKARAVGFADCFRSLPLACCQNPDPTSRQGRPFLRLVQAEHYFINIIQHIVSIQLKGKTDRHSFAFR